MVKPGNNRYKPELEDTEAFIETFYADSTSTEIDEISVPSYNAILKPSHVHRYEPGQTDLNPDNDLILCSLQADRPVYIGATDDSIHTFYQEARKEIEYTLGEADRWTQSVQLHDAPADIGIYEQENGTLHVKIEATTTDSWFEHGVAMILHPLLTEI